MRLLQWLHSLYMRHASSAGNILTWLGAILLVLAAVFAAHSWYGTRPYQRATATVTENIAEMTPHDGVLYHPHLRFRAPDETLIQVIVKEGTPEVEFSTGTDLPVQYPAAEPSRAVIATVWRIYSIGITFAIVGAIFFDIGYLLRLFVRKQASVRE